MKRLKVLLYLLVACCVSFNCKVDSSCQGQDISCNSAAWLGFLSKFSFPGSVYVSTGSSFNRYSVQDSGKLLLTDSFLAGASNLKILRHPSEKIFYARGMFSFVPQLLTYRIGSDGSLVLLNQQNLSLMNSPNGFGISKTGKTMLTSSLFPNALFMDLSDPRRPKEINVFATPTTADIERTVMFADDDNFAIAPNYQSQFTLAIRDTPTNYTRLGESFGSSTANPGTGSQAATLTSNEKFIFAAEDADIQGLRSYEFDKTAMTITPVQQDSTGQTMLSIALDSQERLLFVGESNTPSIRIYRIDSGTGGMTLLNSIPGFTANAQELFLCFNDAYLYATALAPENLINTYRIDYDSVSLTQIDSVALVGADTLACTNKDSY